MLILFHKNGDLTVWGLKHSRTGHIAIATGEGTKSYFYSYDQNWNGKKMKKVKHSYKDGFVGVLRPRNQSNINLKITYQAHVQDIGWQEPKTNWEIAGTEGQEKRIEAIKINCDIPIKYRVHMAEKGWSNWKSNNETAGTIGESRRIEAIEIVSEKVLKGQAHVQNEGWQKEQIGSPIILGTTGKSLRLEAFRLKIL